MRTVLRRLVLTLALFTMATVTTVAAPPATAQIEGSPDTSFYFDGKYTLPPTAGSQIVRDVVVAPDGRLVIAGSQGGSLFWTALDGETAPTICSPPNVAGSVNDYAYAATFDGQGRLLLAGEAFFPDGVGQEGIALRYLYPACDLDETFNLDGIFRTDYSANAELRAIAVDSDSRVVLGGYLSDDLGDGEQIVAVRLTNNGLYDLAFAGDGHLELDLGTWVWIHALQIQTDDRILLAGVIADSSEGYNFLALRLDPLGDLDSTFSGDGVAQVDFGTDGDILHDLAVDPETGGLILAGSSGHYPSAAAVARLTAGGALDTTFGGGDGRWTHSITYDTRLYAVAAQSDGKLLLAGDFNDLGEDRDFVAFRLTPSGALDETFGFLGAAGVAFDLGGALNDSAYAATLHGGNFVLAGSAADSPSLVGAVARLWIALVFADGFESGAAGQWSAAQP